MTTTEQQTPAETETGRPLLVREFRVEAVAGDKRTLDVRIVPFDEIATVADPPDFRPYREQWMPGVFARQERAANRILLRFEHTAIDGNGQRKPGLAGVVGHGLSLRGSSDGYYGSFRLHEGAEADTARTLVDEGVITGVSAEFIGIRSVRTRDGIVQRHKAHLDSVALTRNDPAYSKAQVLALREESIVDEAMLPPAPSRELLERCQRLGIHVPERMQTILVRAFTDAEWDGSASRWPTAAAYCAASAIDLNPEGQTKTKDRCHLPFKEPGSGDVNVNGVRAALQRLGEGFPKDATQEERDRARAMLERLLEDFNGQNSNT